MVEVCAKLNEAGAVCFEEIVGKEAAPKFITEKLLQLQTGATMVVSATCSIIGRGSEREVSEICLDLSVC